MVDLEDLSGENSGSFSLLAISTGVSLSRKDSSKSRSLPCNGALEAEGVVCSLSARLETGGLPLAEPGAFRSGELPDAASRLCEDELGAKVSTFRLGRRRWERLPLPVGYVESIRLGWRRLGSGRTEDRLDRTERLDCSDSPMAPYNGRRGTAKCIF